MKKRATIDNRMFSLNSLSQNNVFEIIFGMQDMKLNGCENDKRWDWEKTQVSIYKVLSEGLKLSQYQLSGGVMLNQVKRIGDGKIYVLPLLLRRELLMER